MGKGIAGGFPFAGFAVSEKVSQLLEKDDHGGTYCGNPLGCAISYAVINHLVENNIADQVKETGFYLQKKLSQLQNQFPELIREVRGVGLMCAFDFFDQSLTRPFTLACADAGLLVVPTRNGIIRLLPDLLVTQENIDKAIRILGNTLKDF
jgi:acetylornithine/N-succinyldiaminopimelate aminotransferase